MPTALYNSPISLRVNTRMLPGRWSPSDTDPDVGAHQLLHRVSDLRQQPPHDPFAALVQRQTHQRLARHLVHQGEIVDMCRSVVQFDPVAQLAAQPTGHRADDRREISLWHLERRVHQPVGQLTVVGQQHQPLGVGVEAADVKQLLVSPAPGARRDHRRTACRGRRTSSNASPSAC